MKAHTADRIGKHFPGYLAGHIRICSGNSIGRCSCDHAAALQLGGIAFIRHIFRCVIELIRPGDHHDTRYAHTPVVENLMIRASKMRFNIVIEWLIRSRRGNDSVDVPAPDGDHGTVGFSYIPEIVLHYIIDVVRVAECCPLQVEKGLTLA